MDDEPHPLNIQDFPFGIWNKVSVYVWFTSISLFFRWGFNFFSPLTSLHFLFASFAFGWSFGAIKIEMKRRRLYTLQTSNFNLYNTPDPIPKWADSFHRLKCYMANKKSFYKRNFMSIQCLPNAKSTQQHTNKIQTWKTWIIFRVLPLLLLLLILLVFTARTNGPMEYRLSSLYSLLCCFFFF